MDYKKYKVGEKVEVVARLEGHGFRLGGIVEIKTMRPEMDFFCCTDGKNEWGLSEAEFEKLDD